MKKWIAIVLAVACLLSLACCADPSATTAPNFSVPTTTAKNPDTTPPATTTPIDPIPERPQSVFTRMPDYYAKLYVYSDADLDYTIQLYLYENYRYSIRGSIFSSFLHQGYWRMDGDILVAGNFSFRVTDEGLVFLADQSEKPGTDIAMIDGALFTEYAAEEKTATISIYSLPMEDSQHPASLYLFDSGYYSFIGPAALGVKQSGSWSIDGDILHLEASRTVSNRLNWYFRMEEDGIVFLAKDSSAFPLEAAIADGDKMLLVGDPMTTYSTTQYVCQPASGGFEFHLRLYDCQYYEMTGPSYSTSGYWYMDGDTLCVGAGYRFHVSEDGLIFLANQSKPLKGFVNGDFFAKTPPHYGKDKAYCYTAPDPDRPDPYRLTLSANNNFYLAMSDPDYGFDGKWTIEENMLTLKLGNDVYLYFRLSGNTAIFLKEQSDPLPYGLALPRDLTLQLVKPAALP